MSGKAHTGHHMPLSTSAGYQKMCSRNKIFKAEIYSDWTNELLIPDSKEFKFILFSLLVQNQSEGTSECQPWGHTVCFPKKQFLTGAMLFGMGLCLLITYTLVL